MIFPCQSRGKFRLIICEARPVYATNATPGISFSGISCGSSGSSSTPFFQYFDMSKYWKNGVEDDPDDPQEIPEKLIPGVALVAYTGRASQMIKRNFPRDWHGNIMTIHRLLGFYPVWNDVPDPESGIMRKKVQFVPTYNADFKMPWKVILIDEAGMLGLDLWHQLLAACTD